MTCVVWSVDEGRIIFNVCRMIYKNRFSFQKLRGKNYFAMFWWPKNKIIWINLCLLLEFYSNNNVNIKIIINNFLWPYPGSWSLALLGLICFFMINNFISCQNVYFRDFLSCAFRIKLDKMANTEKQHSVYFGWI